MSDQPLDDEPVRTLFVSGLPLDVKPREVHNMFRFYAGFESSSLSSAGERKMPVAFVVFTDQDTALAARDQLNGINFDPELPVALRIELAKSNSKSKRRRGHGADDQPEQSPSNGSQSEKRMRSAYGIDPYTAYMQTQMTGVYGDGTAMYQGYPAYMSGDPYLVPQGGAAAHPPRSYPPCSTLFVGNLSGGTNEKELEDKFRVFPGFERLKISRKENNLMCFVEFQNMQYSSYALNSLQGTTLASSDRGPIRIEFARNRMGDSIKGQGFEVQQQ